MQDISTDKFVVNINGQIITGKNMILNFKNGKLVGTYSSNMNRINIHNCDFAIQAKGLAVVDITGNCVVVNTDSRIIAKDCKLHIFGVVSELDCNNSEITGDARIKKLSISGRIISDLKRLSIDYLEIIYGSMNEKEVDISHIKKVNFENIKGTHGNFLICPEELKYNMDDQHCTIDVSRLKCLHTFYCIAKPILDKIDVIDFWEILVSNNDTIYYGLRHARHLEFTYYNGVVPENIVTTTITCTNRTSPELISKMKKVILKNDHFEDEIDVNLLLVALSNNCHTVVLDSRYIHYAAPLIRMDQIRTLEFIDSYNNNPKITLELGENKSLKICRPLQKQILRRDGRPTFNAAVNANLYDQDAARLVAEFW